MTVDFLGPASPDPFLFNIVTMIGSSFAGNGNIKSIISDRDQKGL